MGKYIFKSVNIKPLGEDKRKYLYITISPLDSTIIYTDVQTKITSYPSGGELISFDIPQNEYYPLKISKTVKKQVFFLKKAKKEDTVMDIEYYKVYYDILML